MNEIEKPQAGTGSVSRMNTAGDVVQALRVFYPSREYALMCEVRNGTGFSRQARTMDALVVSLWPSRGLEFTGIEIKISRADWLRELKDPEKAEEMAQYCDRWMIAVSEPEIVKKEELPLNWGLLIPNGKGSMKVATTGARLAPKPLDRSFVAAILRRCSDTMTPTVCIKDDLQKQFEVGLETGKKQADRLNSSEFNSELVGLRKLRKSVEEFELQSGIKIDRYSEYFSGEIGCVVKKLRETRTGTALEEYRILQRRLSEMTDAVAAYIEGTLSVKSGVSI